jgi:transposase
MVSFKNSFNRQKQSWRQHFYQDEYDFKIKIFYDSSSLMDLNQQLKFDENE